MNEVEFHVALCGNDRARGTADSPFRSLRRARDAVRAARDGGSCPTVLVHPGTYHLTEPLEFGPEDGCGVEPAVRWQALGGPDAVTIAGGRTLRPRWRAQPDGIHIAQLQPGLEFDQLFVDGRRQILARYPSYREGEILGGHAADAISPERAARWRRPETGFVRALHTGAWGGNSFRIRGFDQSGGVRLDWVGDNNRGEGMHATYRMVEGLFEELDSPGEWFYDKDSGELYFHPPADLDLATATIRLGELDQLIRIVGDGSRRAGGLVLSGFTFTATHRTLFRGEYEPLLLGDWAVVRAGAVYLRDAENVRIEQCRFDQLGGNAVFLDGYNRGHTVVGCVFTGSGASDVLCAGARAAVRGACTWQEPHRTLRDPARGPATEDYPREITVTGNHMSGCGEYEKQSAAVQISAARRITVARNTIHRVPRAGININDGTWGGHVIERNDIFDCVRESADHGPINAWGRDRFWPLDADDATKKRVARLDVLETTVIRGNRIHHTGDWGIDLDDGATGYVIHGNLLLDCGVKLREGFGRQVTGNLLVGGSVHCHVSYAGNDDLIARNIFLGPVPYRLIRSDPVAGNTTFGHNLFWNDGEPVRFPCAAWQEQGFDTNSPTTDPLIQGPTPWQEPARGRYPLSPRSPALALGFAPLPTHYGVPGAPTPPPVTWHAVPEALEACGRELLGALATAVFDERVRSATGLTDDAGIYLARVPNHCAAYIQGLRTNDVIRQIGDTAIGDDAEFWRHYDALDSGGHARIVIWRDQTARSITLVKPAT